MRQVKRLTKKTQIRQILIRVKMMMTPIQLLVRCLVRYLKRMLWLGEMMLEMMMV